MSVEAEEIARLAEVTRVAVLQRDELESRLSEALQVVMNMTAINKDLHVKLGIGIAGHDDTVKKLKVAISVRNEAVAIVQHDRDALNHMELELLSVTGLMEPGNARVNVSAQRRACGERARGLTAWLATASSDAPRKK